MQELVRTLSEHPLAAIAVCFATLLILYFLFKNLIKLALILIIIAMTIGGYYYFHEPRSKPADLSEAVEKARIETRRAIEKGREMVDKGKAAIDAGIGKGKEVVDRGKETADEVGKIIGGEREAGKK